LNDSFGFSLAHRRLRCDHIGDLAIGVPGEGTVSFMTAPVNVLYGSLGGLTADSDQLWHQDTPGVPGASEHEDMFGMVLAAGDFEATRPTT
jgi:hypothetical protein